MDDTEPETLGYRVMDEVAFEIARRAVREKVDNFLKERDLTPTGQERANLYRRNYYHTLFWMMAQPVASPISDESEDEDATVLWTIDIPKWVTSWETRMWASLISVGLGCLLLGYIMGRP